MLQWSTPKRPLLPPTFGISQSRAFSLPPSPSLSLSRPSATFPSGCLDPRGLFQVSYTGSSLERFRSLHLDPNRAAEGPFFG